MVQCTSEFASLTEMAAKLSCSTGIPTLISEFNPGGYLNTPPGVVIRNGVGQMWAVRAEGCARPWLLTARRIF